MTTEPDHVVIHTHSGKKHLADANAATTRDGQRYAVCSSITYGRETDDAVRWAARWTGDEERARKGVERHPWCRHCEKRARDAGIIPRS